MTIFKRRTPIALKVGSRYIHAVQLENPGLKDRLVAWARLPRVGEAWGNDEALAAWSALQRQGFEGRAVVMAAPTGVAMASLLDLSPRGDPKEEAVDHARAELARMHRLDPQAFECLTWSPPSFGRAAAGGRVMAVCCPHTLAEALIAPLDAVGARVIALDVGCLALARATRRAFSPAGLGVIVHLAWESVRFVAVCGGHVAYERVLPQLGWKKCHERLMEATGLAADMIEEVLRGLAHHQVRRPGVQVGVTRARPILDDHVRATVQELRPSLTYLDGRFAELPLEGILITGEGAGLTDWPKAVQAATGSRCSVFDAAEAVAGASALPPDAAPALTLAVGLARYPIERLEAAA